MDNSNETLKRYYNKKKKRRQRKKFVFYSMLTVFFVLLVTILSLTVFFNINDIAVTGNEYYSAETIVQVSGLTEGQNLFRLNKFKIIDGMYEQLPYLAEITIDRHLPVGIEIIVRECTPYLYIESGGAFYILDENLKILEQTDTAPENLPLVTGLEPSSLIPGAVLTDESGLANRLGALTAALKKYMGDDCVSAINVSASYDFSFDYMERLEVKVGTVEDVEHKLELVKYVINDNKSNEEAIIDVSSGTKAYYRSVDKLKEQEQTEEQTEPENDGEQPSKEND